MLECFVSLPPFLPSLFPNFPLFHPNPSGVLFSIQLIPLFSNPLGQKSHLQSPIGKTPHLQNPIGKTSPLLQNPIGNTTLLQNPLARRHTFSKTILATHHSFKTLLAKRHTFFKTGLVLLSINNTPSICIWNMPPLHSPVLKNDGSSSTRDIRAST